MKRPDMGSSANDTSPGFLARRSVQIIIFLVVGTALGLTYNTFNPDGIPLIKRMPTVHSE